MNPTKPCKATASSGAIKCELARDHAGHHSSLKPGQKKTAQHVTWTTIADGRVEVTTYRGGKKDGNWFEGEARAARDPDDAAEAREAEEAALADEVAAEREADVQREIANPSHAEERLRAGEGVGLAELVAAREAKDRKNAAKAQLEPVKPPAKVSKIYTKAEREQIERTSPSIDSAATIRAEEALGAYIESQPSRKLEIKSTPKVHRAAGAITIAGYPRHPAAALYEMLPEVELEKLAADIKANGLHEAIVILEERGHGSQDWILDGSNRARACEIAGVPPRFARYEGRPDMASLIAYVVGKNDRRRHESEAQRALRANEAATLAQGQKQTSPGSGLTQAAAGVLVGVSERSVGRARAVIRDGVPELVAAVKQGKVDLKGAEQVAKLSPAKQREIVKERIDTSKGPVRGGKLASLARQEERRDVVRKINSGSIPSLATMPSSFGVLLWDPPWDYDNSDDHDSARGHIKYPSMSHEQLVELGREALTRLRDDAVIVTWATNPRMPAAVHLVEALGLTWQSMGTWVKERIGVAPTNMRSRTEHYIIATRGKPVHTLNEVSTWLGDRPIDRTSNHSEKPSELHELLEAHCSGPYLEIFARAPRDRWSTWGAEADKFTTTEAA